MTRNPRLLHAYIFLGALLTLAFAGMPGRAQTFVQPHKITGVYAPYTLAFGDVNGDGLTDIVMGSTAGYASFIQVYLAQPGGGYKNSATLPFFSLSNGYGPVPGCLLSASTSNSDHKLDIVISGSLSTAGNVPRQRRRDVSAGSIKAAHRGTVPSSTVHST